MTLKLGDIGPAVVALQTKLIALGFPITADGHFGARTDDSVRGVQLVTKLAVDGLVGPTTEAALTSGAWQDGRDALMFAALGRIERTDTVMTQLLTTIVTADVKWPLFAPDGFIAPAVNAAMRALAERVVASTVADPPLPEAPLAESTITGEIEATLLVGSIVGAHGSLSEFFSGAAHPNPVVITAVGDVAANRLLKPAELFMPGANWTAALKPLAQVHFPGADPAGVAAKVKNYKHLTITPNGVKVVFESGQILPLAAGAPAFVASWSSLATVVRPSIVARAIGGDPGGPGPHVS